MQGQKLEESSQTAIGITTKVRIKPEDTGSAINLLTRLTMESAKIPGLLNAEVSPPATAHGEWIIIQRFREDSQADEWKRSKIRQETLEKLTPYLLNGHLAEETAVHDCEGTVAACIASMIKPGMEEAYCDWLTDIQTAQAQFPGYQGTYVQRPVTNNSNLWTTLLRFSNPDSLDNWFASKQRLELIERGKQLVAHENIRRMTSSFPGWLPIDEEGKSPPNWKASMLVLLGLYPIVVLEIKYFMPLMAGLHSSLATFIGNAVSVSCVTWTTMPILTRLFKDWLLPPDASNRLQVELTGFGAVVILYALSIFLLSLLP